MHTLKELIARGYAARAERDSAESRAAFFEAVREASLEADRPALAEALCGLAQAERDIGALGPASHQYANAIVLYREIGPPAKLAYALRHEADVFREMCRAAEAEPLYLEAETIYRQLGRETVLDLANTLRGLALVNETTGNVDQAKKLWNEARELYADCDVQAGVSECDKKLSQLAK
jgi:tetratricopeptide (TPR) repeat protein